VGGGGGGGGGGGTFKKFITVSVPSDYFKITH